MEEALNGSRPVLAGDIGGTNMRLALFEERDGRLLETERVRFHTRDVRSLSAAIRGFLEGKGPVRGAGFGVAGPVRHGRAHGTNVDLEIDASGIAADLGAPAVVLNDLAANAAGLGELGAADFAVLNRGDEDPEGNGALISAGTGLGEAILLRTPAGFVPIPSEGGHASFSARGDEEIALLSSLSSRFGHVSWERVLSGPGLANVYRCQREASKRPEPAWLAKEIQAAGDPAPAVAAAALSGRDPVCEATLHRFAALYGAEAGNLALKALATGGVFVGGGIAPRILPVLLDGAFFTAFCDKGRLAPLLGRIPIKVVLNDACALLGAARAAARSAAMQENP